MNAKSTHISAMMASEKHPCFSSMPPHATVADALADMVNKNMSAIAVMQDGRLQGIVTRTDMLKALTPAPDTVPGNQPIARIMTQTLVVAGPEQTVSRALERMAQSDIKHLPVVHQDRLVTIVHQTELLNHQIDCMDADIIHLHEYIEGLHNAGQD